MLDWKLRVLNVTSCNDESACEPVKGHVPPLKEWNSMTSRIIPGLAVAALLLGSVEKSDASLISFWSGNGSASDSAGSNSATWFGSESYAAGHQASRLAFNFDGNSGVQAATAGLPTGAADRTLDLWFNIRSPDVFQSFFAGYGAFGSATQSFALGADSTGVFFSQWGNAIYGPSPSIGEWHNLAVTSVANSATLYFDGAPVAASNISIDTASGTSFYIGENGVNSELTLIGLIDDVRVYDTTLSSAEIRRSEE